MRLIDVDNFLKQYSDQVPGDTIDAIDLRLALLKESTVEAIPIKWLCDYAVIIAENNYEQAKFIFRLIENYKSELNEDKDKAAIDNLKRMKENWLKIKKDDLLPNCVQHAMAMKEIEEQMKEKLLPLEEFEEFVNYTAGKMKEECGNG